MKKIVALLLALTMLTSLTVTALAAGEQSGTTTITAVVPGPSYTIKIPANKTLEYGNTEKQLLGNVTVSDVADIPAGKKIGCKMAFQDLKCGTDTIPVQYLLNGYEINGDLEQAVYGSSGINLYTLYAQVSEEAWTSAAPGTYTATITFNFYLYD